MEQPHLVAADGASHCPMGRAECAARRILQRSAERSEIGS